MVVKKYTISLSKGKSKFSINPYSRDFLGRFSHQETRELEGVVTNEFTVRAASHFNPTNNRHMDLRLDLPTDSDSMGIMQYLTDERGYVINKVKYEGEK